MNKKKIKLQGNATLKLGNSLNFFVIFFDNFLMELKIQIKNFKFFFFIFFYKKIIFSKKK